jgi:hypothetical protein
LSAEEIIDAFGRYSAHVIVGEMELSFYMFKASGKSVWSNFSLFHQQMD